MGRTRGLVHYDAATNDPNWPEFQGWNAVCDWEVVGRLAIEERRVAGY